MEDIYENIDEYNPNNHCKILITFDNLIADMLSIRLNSTHDFIMKIPNKREIIETVI